MVDRVATQATDIIGRVHRLRKMLLCLPGRMAAQAAFRRLCCAQFFEVDDLGDVAATLNMCRSRTVAGLAIDSDAGLTRLRLA